jgi:hypothetical protein
MLPYKHENSLSNPPMSPACPLQIVRVQVVFSPEVDILFIPYLTPCNDNVSTAQVLLEDCQYGVYSFGVYMCASRRVMI